MMLPFRKEVLAMEPLRGFDYQRRMESAAGVRKIEKVLANRSWINSCSNNSRRRRHGSRKSDPMMLRALICTA